MEPILAYLRDGVLPKEKEEAKKILYQAANYTLVDGMLYKQRLSLSLLRCLQLEERKRVLHKLHGGDYNNHIKSHADLCKKSI